LSESLDAKKVDVEEDMAVGMPSSMNPAPLTCHAAPGPLTQPPDPIITGKGEAPASDDSPLPESDGGDTQGGPPPSSYPSPQSSNTFTSWRDGEPGEPPDAPTEERAKDEPTARHRANPSTHFLILLFNLHVQVGVAAPERAQDSHSREAENARRWRP